MRFGICFKGSLSPRRTVGLCREAERAGFSHAWFYDSHILWRDPYPAMAAGLARTERLRFGPCVTNPDVRHWSVAASLFASLAVEGGNRIDMGVGRGDSSMRVMGRRPASVARMTRFVCAVKALVRGDEVRYEDAAAPVRLSWATGYELPVWIAAYGPRALAAAGEHGDGLILQLADPALCGWFAAQAIAAGRAAGRDMLAYRVMSAAPTWVGPVAEGIERTRWFPAMVGNHVADIVERYGGGDDRIPRPFTAYIERRKGYDYRRHADVDAEHLDFVTDDVVASFGILGNADDHVEKLRALARAGVTDFTIYLMNGQEEQQLAAYAKEILPHFRDAAED